MIRLNRLSFWLSMLLTGLVIASDAPPLTLPKGFLEQLPLLEQLSDNEFDALAQFATAQQSQREADRDVEAADGEVGEVRHAR